MTVSRVLEQKILKEDKLGLRRWGHWDSLSSDWWVQGSAPKEEM